MAGSAMAGSAIIFWYKDWIKCPHDPPLATAFVQAVALEKISPGPGGAVDEKAVCKVKVDGTMHDCLVLTIDVGRSLAEQFEIVAKDKKHLEARGAWWIDHSGGGSASADRVQPEPAIPPPPPPAQLIEHVVQVEAAAAKSAPVDPSPARNALNPSNVQNLLPPFETVELLANKPAAKPNPKPALKPAPPRASKKLAGVNFTPVRNLRVPLSSDRTRRSVSMVNYAFLDGFDSDDDDEKAEVSSASGARDDRASMPSHRRTGVQTSSVARASSSEPTKKPQPTSQVVFREPTSQAVLNAAGTETDAQTLTHYIVTNAKTVKRAVQLAVEELFTSDDILNGVFTQRALNKLSSTGQQTAKIFDEQKMAVLLEAVNHWKKTKFGNNAFLNEINLWNYMREIKKELRLQASAAAGEEIQQGSASKKMKI